MSKKKEIAKTNVMRLLEEAKIPYVPHAYDPKIAVAADDVAHVLNEDPSHVFKTLVTVGKSGDHYVFVLPATSELDLKKAAKAAGEKYIEMIPQKNLLPLTGYIHGGCSPVGMKKAFPTYIDISGENLPHIFVSGGKVGLQVEVKPKALAELISASFVDITEEKR